MQYFYKNANHAILLKGHVIVFVHPSCSCAEIQLDTVHKWTSAEGR